MAGPTQCIHNPIENPSTYKSTQSTVCLVLTGPETPFHRHCLLLPVAKFPHRSLPFSFHFISLHVTSFHFISFHFVQIHSASPASKPSAHFQVQHFSLAAQNNSLLMINIFFRRYETCSHSHWLRSRHVTAEVNLWPFDWCHPSPAQCDKRK